MASGLFVGLITLDCIYRVERVPSSNDKLVAEDCLLAAGGPATNAAIAFAALGNRATLAAALGCHPLAALVQAELVERGVALVDLTPLLAEPPPLSTILVTAATGDRAVISRNALGRQGDLPVAAAALLEETDILLVDGHQMAAGAALAQAARAASLPVVVDAGSWKPGFETVLPWATSAIAAAKFRLPQQVDTLVALADLAIPEVAITHGAEPIQVCYRGQRSTMPVLPVAVQDTLGAGDIFHGAFCHYRLHHNFLSALALAAQVAAQSCRYFGPRAWIDELDYPR